MPARGFLGSGDLYITSYNFTTQTWGTEQGPFEARKFAIKPNSQQKELISRSRSQYGQAIESVVIPQPADISMDLTEINRNTLALALFGTVTTTAADSPTPGDPAGYTVAGATQPQIRAQFRLEGRNYVDGSPVRVTVREAVLSAQGEVDFLSDDFVTVTLAGKLKTPAGEDEPFTVRVTN
jgi:hypothetical protein